MQYPCNENYSILGWLWIHATTRINLKKNSTPSKRSQTQQSTDYMVPCIGGSRAGKTNLKWKELEHHLCVEDRENTDWEGAQGDLMGWWKCSISS